MYKNSPGSLPVIWMLPGFNPCFNGSMYKNPDHSHSRFDAYLRFNPCFNGSMYKNIFEAYDYLADKVFQSLF